MMSAFDKQEQRISSLKAAVGHGYSAFKSYQTASDTHSVIGTVTHAWQHRNETFKGMKPFKHPIATAQAGLSAKRMGSEIDKVDGYELMTHSIRNGDSQF